MVDRLTDELPDRRNATLSDGLARRLPDSIRLESASPAERDFLLTVYAGTRAEELAVVPWSDSEKAAFVAQQFEAQDRAYRAAYADGEFLVVLRDGVPVGRLILARIDDEIRVVDIALSAEHRGLGLGTAILRALVALADDAARPVTLHVESWNRARSLYERLGFRTVQTRGIHELMRREPVLS